MPMGNGGSCDALRVGVVSTQPILADGLACVLGGVDGLASVEASGDLEVSTRLLADGAVEVLVVEEALLTPPLKSQLEEALRGRPSSGVVVLRTGAALPEIAVPAHRWQCVDTRLGAAGVLAALRSLTGAAHSAS